MLVRPNTGSLRTPHMLCATLLICAAIFTMFAWGCGKEPASTTTSHVSLWPTPEPYEELVLTGQLPQWLEVDEDDAVRSIDDRLREYREVRIVMLDGVDGEVFPCGCSDGQIGGLIGLLPKLRKQEPALVVSLGDNYVPRSIPAESVARSMDYFRHRMDFVRSTIMDGVNAIELLSPAEQKLATVKGELGVVTRRLVIGEQTVDLLLSRTESWTGIGSTGDRSEPAARLLILAGDNFVRASSLAGIDRALWVAPPVDTDQLPASLSAIARPPSGARGMILLSVSVPVGPSAPKDVMLLDEVLTLRSAILRSNRHSESASNFRSRMENRALAILESRPILLQVRYVPVTVDDAVDLNLYRKYSAFLATHTAVPQTAVITAQDANQSCVPCHADYVRAFESADRHFQAIEPLLHAGKEGDPFCASCHITPLAINAAKAESHRQQFVEGVQCQWCHQAAERHALMPNRIKPSPVTRQVCETCHNENQSPAYVWDQYVRRLSCYSVKKREGTND
jgi:hypothetical protein